MRMIVLMVATMIATTLSAAAQNDRAVEVRTSCEANIRANPLPEGWTLEQALAGCTCLSERTAGEADLQQELVALAPLSTAEVEARQSPRAAEAIGACWAAPTANAQSH